MKSIISAPHLKWILLLVLLVSPSGCASPREKSQALAVKILTDLPVPEGVELLYTKKYERLAKQGVGTGFGVAAYYGTAETYLHVVNQYQSLLTVQGWQEYASTTWDTPWFCNPEYQNVRLELGSVDRETIRTPDIITNSQITYQTFYRIKIVQFPFDGIGGCQASD